MKCGGRPGRINDTKAFEECPWKGSHYRREQILADGGYPACGHCVYPYYCEREEVDGQKRSKKERKKERKALTPEERERNDVFNKALRFFRTRIEILFGMLVRHRFMNGSGYSVETVRKLFHLMWEMEKLAYDQRPTEMHPAKVVNVEERIAFLNPKGGDCMCAWRKVYAHDKDRPKYEKRRDRIADRCVRNGNAAKIRAWAGKPSKHGKKNAPKSKTAAFYQVLSQRPDLTEHQRTKMLKPHQDEQKIVDDALAEIRTAPQPIATGGTRSHHSHAKRDREQRDRELMADESEADESEDDFSSSASLEEGSSGMGSSTGEED